jgi:RNA polymerase sigma-70 factor (ECF subfamily)
LQEKLYQEQEAFTALQNGIEKGLDFFFRHYYSPLIIFSRSITNNEAASQDIVSDAFTKLWKNRHDIEEWRKVKYLLYHIVRNASIDFLRKEKSQKQLSEIFKKHQSNFEGTILEKLIETETYNQLYTLLAILPPRSRQIFQMFYFQDKAIKEIARDLGISVNTVKTQKQRALQMLKKHRTSFTSFLFIFLLFF